MAFISDDELKRKKELEDTLSEEYYNMTPYQKSSHVDSLYDQAMKSKADVDNYGDFAFSKQDMYDRLEDSYLNRKKFSWDADSDMLYQIYRDKYTRGAKMAMQDTMGQAAAMTGGYGNSYAQSVGQQTYNNYMAQLNDVMPQLYQLALERYNYEGNEMKNKIGVLQSDRSTEYGEWGDKYNRLLDTYNRDYGLYSDEYSRERAEHNDAIDLLASKVGLSQSGYGNSYNRDYNEYRDEIEDQRYEQEYELAKIAQNKSGSGGSGGSGSGSNVNMYTFSYVDDDGLYHFTDYKGKDVKKAKGVNPYTGTKNPDAQGTGNAFSNGYQPNNIGGKKLYANSEGKTYNMNGRAQTIWVTYGGTRGNTPEYWVWDGTQNKYLSITATQFKSL